MTASPGDLRLVLFAVTVVAGVVAAFLVARGVGWRAAAPLVPIAATPLVPSLPIALGVSTDDVLPATGIILGLVLLDWRAAIRAGWPRLLVLGAALMAAAGLVASIANASSAPTFATMALKSAGHVVFLALVAVVVVAATPPERRRPFVARAVALVATFEAVFGLLAWFLPLPGSAGLEATRQMTSLLGRVPGRVAGTTGLSPNFLGALFVISIPITAALALSSSSSRARVAWWSATAVQVLALTLTFTRTSLIIAVGALVVLLLLRGDVRILLGILVIVGAVMLVTPLGARMIGDANDRAALWTAAVRMMVDEPLTGVGPGRTLIVAEAEPERYRVTEYGVATNNAHNTILLAGAETGVAGAVGALAVNVGLAAMALSVLLATAGPARWRRLAGDVGSGDLGTAAALGTLGFLVQGMTNNLFAVQVTSVWAMLVVAAFLVPAPLGIRALLARRSDVRMAAPA